MASTVKRKLSVKEVVQQICEDSESDISSDDIEYSDTESETDVGVQSSVVPTASNVGFNWLDYPYIDPWEPSWLPDFQPSRGVLVNTLNFEPVDYFKLFFPETVFDLMSAETNRYADSFLASSGNLSPYSRFREWKPTTVEEIKGFVALQIEMGLDWRYNFREHWSTRYLSPGGFGQVMPRNRYILLQSFLHFCDNAQQRHKGEDGYNPLFKVQRLIDLTIPTYRQVYQPGRDLSVDESMVKFKGRLCFRQYMPDKPTKYGIKDFVLAESSTGFCLNVMTYTGKYSFPRQDQPLSTQVVLDLLRGYENQGHVVYMDNFYSSPDLFQELQQKGIGACGTVRSNRKNMPPDFRPDKLRLKRGDDPLFMRSDDLVAIAWHDVKRVTCLTTVHTNNTCEKTIRQKGNPDGRLLEKPVALEEYNNKMSGVDRLDQMLATHGYSHKCMKWYQPLYHRIREIALSNGYVLYKQDKGSVNRLDAAAFRKKVVDGLLSEYVAVDVSRRPGRPSGSPAPVRLTDRHFPGSYSDKKYHPDCVVCSNRQTKQRHQCKTFCKQCNLPMHAVVCFERYHSLLHYQL